MYKFEIAFGTDRISFILTSKFTIPNIIFNIVCNAKFYINFVKKIRGYLCKEALHFFKLSYIYLTGFLS